MVAPLLGSSVKAAAKSNTIIMAVLLGVAQLVQTVFPQVVAEYPQVGAWLNGVIVGLCVLYKGIGIVLNALKQVQPATASAKPKKKAR